MLPSNLRSIAELNFYPQTKAFAILNEEAKIVGFTTYGLPVGEKAPKLFRLMIDQNYQGCGYGKAALIAVLKKLFTEYKSEEVQVCYDPQQAKLKKFYSAVGFKEKELLPSKLRQSGKMLAILQRDDFNL